MEYPMKEVLYYKYCASCKHGNKKENEDPCDDCLAEFANEYSHKPTKWEAK